MNSYIRRMKTLSLTATLCLFMNIKAGDSANLKPGNIGKCLAENYALVKLPLGGARMFLLEVPKDSPVIVIRYLHNEYGYVVSYHGVEGFIGKNFIDVSNVSAEFKRDRIQEAKDSIERVRAVDEFRKMRYYKYLDSLEADSIQKVEKTILSRKLDSISPIWINRFGYSRYIQFREAMMERSVLIGMTETMARIAWGEPKKINTTTSKYGTRAQWVYYESYLYFDNGILTAIQN